MKKLILLSLILIQIFSIRVTGQNKINVTGVVTDSLNTAVPFANVIIMEGKEGGVTDEKGRFSFTTVENFPLTIVVSSIGFVTQEKEIDNATEVNDILFVLQHKEEKISEVSVRGEVTDQSFARIDPVLVNRLPDAGGGNIEGLIKSQMGVTSNNELSSQYRVRGGNYDENIVYVNDIEIYRPFLVRSGQQEGLSFVNPNLVSSLKFSPGGFEAQYGDKMSSVLDVSYKKPNELKSSVSASLLGFSGHVEGSSENKRFSAITGIRYKINA